MGYPSFVTGEVLTAADMNAVGLWRVGTGTATAGTEIIVASCYSASFANYLIQARVQTSSQDVFYQNRSGTTNANTNYNYQVLEAQNVTVSTGRGTNQASHVVMSNSNGAFWQTANITIYSPFVAEPTGIQSVHCRTDGAYTVPSVFNIFGNHNVSTSYNGFRLFVPAGTITGTVYVYGYN